MGREKLIDRKALLDAAENIIHQRGAGGLTINAVAKAVGITKGGVQYCFGTKDALVDALFERWGESYDGLFEKTVGKQSTPRQRLVAHIEATSQADQTAGAKAASLLAGLMRPPGQLSSTREWYASRLHGVESTSTEGRKARLAFLAAEGAFLLRYMGFMEMDEETWTEAYDDIRGLIEQD
ncbi:TetR/AcrR family transcriptional regulator [Rhizobium panacihumi]|uniref:TetR/AcrR family transcriptional regulator n=1 Tax=Rhizobium panacihumi TaxID=2008450 RepID=UPI003D7A9441